MQYLQDYDERYPMLHDDKGGDFAIDANETAWSTIIQLYIKNIQVYQCPREKTAGDKLPTDTTCMDYPFNQILAQQNVARLSAPSLPLMLCEGPTGSTHTH